MLRKLRIRILGEWRWPPRLRRGDADEPRIPHAEVLAEFGLS
ncbi:hypothetical protein [Candidatus Frankia alpina]|nr:hypothetical protein [Candidatus Frankia alpina]